MDKAYLRQTHDDAEVEELLAQLSEESLLTLSLGTHTSTHGIRSSFTEDQSLSFEAGNEGLENDLAVRLASLKAHRPKISGKGKASECMKTADVQKSGSSSSERRRSDKKRAVMSKSPNKSSSFLEEGVQDIAETDGLDAQLAARLRVLKGPSMSLQGSAVLPVLGSGELTNPATSSASLTQQLHALRTRSTKPSPLPPPSSSSVAISSSSVGSSWSCAPTSPFKLLKQLNMIKPDHGGSASSSPTKSSPSEGREPKKALRKSLSRKSKKGELDDEQVDPSMMVADVQRLLAAVSGDSQPERERGSVEDIQLAGDRRTFCVKDREDELIKAMENEDALTLEAEKVVEWAKDAVRLEASESESDDELEPKDFEDSDSSSELQQKPTKKKGRKRWSFM